MKDDATAAGRGAPRGLQVRLWLLPAVLASPGFCASAQAVDFHIAEGAVLRWDNTAGYSTTFRLQDATAGLLADRNRDDGDRNFARGLVSNRFDLLSQLDFSQSWWGFHASGAAWYDTAYYGRNDNNSAATFNSVSVPHNKFTGATQTRHGAQAEVLDAFVYANGEIGGTPVSFRFGRHTLLWGESLFFADNGIAAGQAPIDTTRVLTRPGGYARDAYLPVTQASLSVQLPGEMALEAYYQFEWRRSRLPASGSFFSYRDYYDAGGERFYLRTGQLLFRDRDYTPPSSGQFGLALKGSLGDIDYGFYGLRMNAKDPVPYYWSGISASPGQPPVIVDPSIVNLSINKGGRYNLTYPQGTEIYGASASGYVGNSTIAGEVSMRRHTPLTSVLVFLSPGQVADANTNPGYPVGDTLHAQLSSISNFVRGTLWDSATLSAEVAAAKRIKVTHNASQIEPQSTPLSVAVRASFEPTYYEVLPNLDLTWSLGMGYVAGRSSIHTYQNQGVGSVDLGVTGTYRVQWSGSLLYSHFLGDPVRQPLADRDFVRFVLQRSF